MNRMLRPAVVMSMALLLVGCVAPSGLSRVQADLPVPRAEAGLFAESTPSVAVLGDSLTAWDPAWEGYTELSWMTTAIGLMPVACGWAESGAPIARILELSQPCPEAEYVVIMAGTNDIPIRQRTAIPDRLAGMDAIVETVGAPFVVIMAVPPLDTYPPETLEWNAILADHATAQGWNFIDPWTSYRDLDGSYLPGTAFEDGVHPSAETAAAVATFVADWITQRSAKLQQ